MTTDYEMDVDDRLDQLDEQDYERETIRREGEGEAAHELWLEVALRCGKCDHRFLPTGLEKDPDACPRCGSHLKGRR